LSRVEEIFALVAKEAVAPYRIGLIY
jgi:hypothetical protein